MDQRQDTAPEPADAMATIEHLRKRVRDLTERVRGLAELVSDTEDALTLALKERDALKATVATLNDLDAISVDAVCRLTAERDEERKKGVAFYQANLRLIKERDALKARAEAAEAALTNGKPRYRLVWIAGARPPVHPDPMTGRQSFTSEAEAWRFFRQQAPDARLVSLHKSITIDCGEVNPPADLAKRVGVSHE